MIHKDLHSSMSKHYGLEHIMAPQIWRKKTFKKFRESWMVVAYGNLNQKLTCAA
jgi:hypothetical protein